MKSLLRATTGDCYVEDMCTNDSPVNSIRAGLAALFDQDVVALPDDAVREQLRELVTLANLMQAALWSRVGPFDARSLSHGDGLRTTRAWLSAVGRLSPYAATALVRRARVLSQLPAMADATTSGAVTAEHLNHVVDLVEQVGIGAVKQVDNVLADLAETQSPAELHRACVRIRTHVDPDGPAPDPPAERRSLSVARVGDMVRLRGQLELDAGAQLLAALDALLRPPGPDDLRTAGQRHADALVELCRLSLAAGTLPSTGGLRPQIGILVTPETLTTAPVGATQPPISVPPVQLSGPIDLDRIPSGGADRLTTAGIPPLPEPPWSDRIGPIEAATAQRLACDSVLYRVIYDPASGQPLDVGRAHRTAPSWIRKALHARDQGCRWPGCDSPIPWCDAHHLVEWDRGGVTAVDSMLLLCRWHHVRVHEGLWAIDYDISTGEVRVTRPDGTPYELGPSQAWLRYRRAA
ncbi:MAG: DUF222 domain-containing protein [Betaproteobacteria bacterium]